MASWKGHWFRVKRTKGGSEFSEGGHKGRKRSAVDFKKKHGCFWFGFSVSCPASHARNRPCVSCVTLPASRRERPALSGELVWCTLWSSALSDSRPPFPPHPKAAQTHPSYPEHSPGPRISGHKWGGVFSCGVLCHLSVRWPVGHFLYEVTISRKTSITQETVCNPAQETEWVYLCALPRPCLFKCKSLSILKLHSVGGKW